MGIRDEAEKIISEEKRLEAEKQNRKVTAAMEYLPGAMKQWSEGMGLTHVPEYTNARGVYHDHGGHDPKVHISFGFVEDGLHFAGELVVADSGEPEFNVSMDHGGVNIRTVPDLAQALKNIDDYKKR